MKPNQPPVLKSTQPPVLEPTQPPVLKPAQPPVLKPAQPPVLKPAQPTLAFPLIELSPAALPALPQAAPSEAAIDELEHLGFTTRLHPVALFAHLLPKHNATPCCEVARRAGQSLTVCGWLAASRRHRGTDGRWVRFLTLEDESGLTEAVLFAEANERFAAVLVGPGPYLVTGQAQDQMGAVTLHVSKIQGPPR